MEYRWLNRKNNNELIIFFNGWGMDESVVSHLDCGNYDVLMFYDYNFLNTDFDFQQLNGYSKKHLVAWSMGVMTATLFDINLDSATAINGTLKPIDNQFGIPERIYDLTIKGFNQKGAERFIRNMFDKEVVTINTRRNLDNQKSELVVLKTYSANSDFQYSKVFISDNDKIIPTKNQCAYWNMVPNLSSGHCPFFLFNKWEDVL